MTRIFLDWDVKRRIFELFFRRVMRNLGKKIKHHPGIYKEQGD